MKIVLKIACVLICTAMLCSCSEEQEKNGEHVGHEHAITAVGASQFYHAGFEWKDNCVFAVGIVTRNGDKLNEEWEKYSARYVLSFVADENGMPPLAEAANDGKNATDYIVVTPRYEGSKITVEELETGDIVYTGDGTFIIRCAAECNKGYVRVKVRCDDIVAEAVLQWNADGSALLLPDDVQDISNYIIDLKY